MNPHRWIILFLFDLSPDLAAKITMAETDGKRARAIADGVGGPMKRNEFTLDGPRCFHCEMGWSPAIAALPCPGDPNTVLMS